MVQSGTIVRQKILNKIFNKPPGSDIKIYSVTKTDGAYGGYSGSSKTYASTPVTTIGVPYGYISGNRAYYSMGLNSEGESKIAIRYDVDIKQGDKIVMSTSTQEFEITKIDEYPYNDVNLLYIVTVKELL